MKMFIPLMCLLSFTIAEPPVGDSYASALSSRGYEQNDFQRSPSQQYGLPSQIAASRNSLDSEYGLPKTRTSTRLSTYGPPSRLSEEYGVPSGRSKLSQEYGLPDARNGLSPDYGAPSRTPSQQYGVPSRNSPSQKYGVPKSRNVPSQDYGVPEFRTATGEYSSVRNPSQQYGVPGSRSLSQEYGLPNARESSSHFARNLGSAQSTLYGTPRKSSEKYGTVERKSQPSSHYLPQKSSPFSFNDVAKTGFNSKSSKSTDTFSSYGGSKVDSLYGVPSSSDYSQGFNDFGARVSDTYAGPSKVSQEYGAPRAADLKTNAVASSYASARSLSSTYGAPSVRDGLSEGYGVPEQYNARSSQGYEYARSADEDIQEPAQYDFAYKVNDFDTGSDFGHTESRQENRAEGTYFVVLPDGNKQVVEYEADERGFKPRISVEPADAASGYDDNAADLTHSSDGPY